jgi:hypothetical protein
MFIISVFIILPGCSGGGGGLDGAAGGGSWNKPAVTPTVSSTNPANGDTNVPILSKLSAFFSEAMDPATVTTTTFSVKQGTTDVPGTVAYNGVTAVFSPSDPLLAPNAKYTCTITTGAKNLAGKPLASDYVWSFTTGATPDLTPPTVTGTINANGATAVAINTKVGATFSEAMSPLTITNATFTLKETVSGTAVNGTVSYSGVSAVFAPSVNLTPNLKYTVTVKGGVGGVSDLASPNNVMVSDYVWSWTTGATADTTPPTVTGTIHVNGATGVAINTKVGATFSEGMTPLTITNLNFTLKEKTAGTAVTGTVSYSGVSGVFIPSIPLKALTEYTVTVKGGASGVADLAGNPMTSDFVISWTTAATADTTPPTVTGTIHVNGATGVAINSSVGATFSEGMNPLTITNLNLTLKEKTAGTAVTGTVSYSGVSAVFTPLNPLKALTEYTVTVKGGVGGVEDLVGNPMTSDFVISWTTAATADTTPPTVIGTINADGAVNVATNTKVGATFSEGMDPLTITNLTFTSKETLSAVAVAGSLSYSGVNAVFTPTNILTPNTKYTSTIKSGVGGAKDLAGNAMTSDYVWSWTIGAAPDIILPTVLSTNPDNLAVGVCINKTINATFSESMDPLTVTTDTFKLAVTAGASVTGVVAYDSLTNIATFKPIADLIGTPATNYSVTIKGGASGVKDVVGNALAVDKVTTFTTNASTCTTAPALKAVAPFGGFGGNATLTNDGLNTVINGDIGVNAASTKITGLRDSGVNVYTVTPNNDGLVKGLIYTSTAPPGSVAGSAVTNARADALLAFNSLSPASLPGGIDVSSLAKCPSCGGAGQGPGQLAGRTLPPGVYLSTTGTYGIGITAPTAGNLTLDAGGDANAVWVFQTAAGTGNLTVGLTGPATPAVPIQVLLLNGAQAKNVFWYVPAGATIGTGSKMVGTMLADASITFSTTGGTPPTAVLTTLNGRAICLTAGVTMTNTVITVP